MIVMKFGGTSVGSAARINDVAEIVATSSQKDKVVVVVSAVSGITNLLVESAELAAQRNQSSLDKHLKKIRSMHNEIINDLKLTKNQTQELQQTIDNTMLHLESLIYSVYELAELSNRSRDLITSFGERMSINLVSAAIAKKGLKSEPVLASELIVTTDDFGGAKPLLSESAKKSKPALTKLLSKNIVPVVTGFMGATEQGVATTLGRGGSDYSATILGNCLDASEVWIWTDVDGVMTADPRLVSNSLSISALSYNEATELSYFGARILHPLTMVPAALKEIPIVIKNTMHPEFAGTRIQKKSLDMQKGIKAISTFGGMSLVTLQGKGMIGVPGVAAKLFSAIAAQNINVHFISQASSEFNISFVVKQEDGEKTLAVLREAFQLEFMNKYIEKITKEDGNAIVAVVGEGMRGQPGIAGKIFSSLGNYGINIRAIAQGSSERNISCLIAESDVPQAAQVIHDSFNLGAAKKLHLLHLGIGNVGKSLVEQIREFGDKELVYCGLYTSKGGVFKKDGFSNDELASLKSFTLDKASPSVEEAIEQMPQPFILVDTTASEQTLPLIKQALKRGGYVVMSNKKPISGKQKDFDELHKLGGNRLYYETTVGAGLPVVNALKTLLATGDEVISMQGCFSGTLGFLFSQIEQGRSFSQAVLEAKKLGYTEPDPRDDLSGVDVARKALIIARLLGSKMDMSDVALKGLYPKSMSTLSVDEFLKALPELDKTYKEQSESAKQQGKVLRFVATVTNKQCKVGLEAVDKVSDIGGLAGPDNLIVFTTSRYKLNPLIVKGPGAGIDVTATGVFGDILEIHKRI